MTTWYSDEQDTMPLPILSIRQALLPTVRQLREKSGLSYFQLAFAAQVNPRVAYWFEHGIAVRRQEAQRILHILSRSTGRIYGLTDVRDIRLKPERRGRRDR